MHYFSTLFLCLFVALSANSQINSDNDSIQLKYRYNVQDEVIILAEASSELPEIQADAEALKTFSKEMVRELKRPRQFELLTFNEGEVYYFKGIGRVDEQRVTFAMEIEQRDGLLILHRMNHPWFLCKSDGCNSCDFTITNDGRINRCTCKDSKLGGICNVKSGIKTTTF